ncbi:hypothetical protein POV27_13005 [Aureisphaera galaxeae]|nr:hypothetical protein [Aureisphaera galaxeae]
MRKLTEKQLVDRDVSKVNAPAKTLGFLVDEMLLSDFEKLYHFSADLGMQPKDVRVFSFIETKRKIPSLRQNQVQCKDFNWKGEMHNQNAQEFLDTEFGVLVGYYKGTNEFMDMMISRSKAKFKVGFAGGDERLYDLMIGVAPEQIDLFKSELKKYLTILNKIA